MNRNYLYAAIPFAAIFDIGLIVKAFYGYSDPTMLTLMGLSLVAFVVLVLKAFDKLHLPTLSVGSSQPQTVVHNHYHYPERDEDCDGCDDCEDTYTEEDLEDAREDGRERGYSRGYEEGHSIGYDEGYDERRAEETSEAQELARVILDLMEQKGVVKASVSPLSTVDTPAEQTTSASATVTPPPQA